MVLLNDKVLGKQIQNLYEKIQQKQETEQLYQQKIRSMENQLLTLAKQKRNLEKGLQNEKQDKEKIKERLNILEIIFNKPKKEVSTGTDLSWDERIKELYEELRAKNTKEVQLSDKVEELNEENENLRKGVNELEKNLSGNELTPLPNLPNSLTSLNCYNDPQLTSLPNLPNTLSTLKCYNTRLTSLPNLPNSLITLKCYNTRLTSLPDLPNSLITLDCSRTELTSLPNLPNSLTTLDCANNELMALPNLPSTLTILICFNTQLTSLPNLPNTLTILKCYNTRLTSLLTLPNSLTTLECYNIRSESGGSDIRINQLIFQDAGNSKLKYLSTNFLHRLRIKRGLSNGGRNSGIYVIEPEEHGRFGKIRRNRTIYELSQEGYIVFE